MFRCGGDENCLEGRQLAANAGRTACTACMEELTGVSFMCLGWQGWQLVAAVFHTAITSTAEAQQTVAVGRAESSEPLWQVCCASLQQDVVTAAKSHCAGCACNLLCSCRRQPSWLLLAGSDQRPYKGHVCMHRSHADMACMHQGSEACACICVAARDMNGHR